MALCEIALNPLMYFKKSEKKKTKSFALNDINTGKVFTLLLT